MMAKQDLSINGRCVPEHCKCKCCTNILPLNDYEINKIKKYIRRNNIVPINRNDLKNDTYVDICPFLSEDYKCNIYVMRPEVCKYFRCDVDDASRPFTHSDKSIINMLETFDPDAYIPSDAPNVRAMDLYYQRSKKRLYPKE